MQNIVTWGLNMSANIEEFECISVGGLFSGVPPYVDLTHEVKNSLSGFRHMHNKRTLQT